MDQIGYQTMTEAMKRLELDLFTLAKAFQIIVRLIRMDRLAEVVTEQSVAVDPQITAFCSVVILLSFQYR